MNETTKAQTFREVFQGSLKINARSLSVKTLLSERNLKRINYSPYYQRNYIWDREKQSFFIESVILGTEVPPLILFKSGTVIEVIDGRQRFQTLKLFKENDLPLNIRGLKELQILNKKSFNDLTNANKDIFLDSNIRVFEFEVINHPNLSEEVIDRVKKEIFRRYNTGITPLTRDELDNAKYDEDDFSDLFKSYLRKNHDFYSAFNECFGSSRNDDLAMPDEGVISRNVDFVRRFRILNKFPISTYAGNSSRTEIIDLLYDFANSNAENIGSEFEVFLRLTKDVIKIYNDISRDSQFHNKLIYETLLWVYSVLQENDIPYAISTDDFMGYISKNIDDFSSENSHYYAKVIRRFQTTAKYFERKTGFSFGDYIRDAAFKSRLKDLRQTEDESAKSIEELSNLRLHKPNPTSTPVDEIRNDLKTSKYLLRPSYQRQEKINVYKASAIIESILLGINLPPIFIFKRAEAGIKEVVDGQQRILAIIGFLGEMFKNEDGKLVYSKNNNYKLKGLRILTNLEGKKYSDLESVLQDKILDFVIDQIVIEESMNESFNPIDLFIRLNYKPYPIKPNTFEMWNSIVHHEIVKKTKEVAQSEKSWFFLREVDERKPDRMKNEELIVSLAYIDFNDTYTDVIGFFLRQDRITCRIKDKKGLTSFLIDLDTAATAMNKFLCSIESVQEKILLLKEALGGNPTKDDFNDILNVKGNIRFTRSLQDFYVIWIVLSRCSTNKIKNDSKAVLSDIFGLLKLLKNTDDSPVDEKYQEDFISQLKSIKEKYS